MRRSFERESTVPRHELKPIVGFAASLLAVWCQVLLLATVVMTPLAAGVEPGGTVSICHADDETEPAPQRPDKPAHACALCVVCLSHPSPLAILSPPPALPERQSIAIVRLDAARPRAAPIRLVAAAQPRGPPSFT